MDNDNERSGDIDVGLSAVTGGRAADEEVRLKEAPIVAEQGQLVVYEARRVEAFNLFR